MRICKAAEDIPDSHFCRKLFARLGNRFYEGKVKHIFFVAETKGTMESLELRPIEQAKISCAKKLFNEMSTSKVKYHDVDSYQRLLEIMKTI